MLFLVCTKSCNSFHIRIKPAAHVSFLLLFDMEAQSLTISIFKPLSLSSRTSRADSKSPTLPISSSWHHFIFFFSSFFFLKEQKEKNKSHASLYTGFYMILVSSCHFSNENVSI